MVAHPEQQTTHPETRLSWRQLNAYILAPYLLSRGIIIFTVWASQIFDGGPFRNIPKGAPLSYQIANLIPIWDGAWYLTIVQTGYLPVRELGDVQNNIVFFPLYPFFVRILTFMLPPSWQTYTNIAILGAIVSNVFFIFILIYLFKLTQRLTQDENTAKRAVFYLLIFPSSFYFSIVYTEATYLVFAILCFWMLYKRNWELVGLFGGLAALCRPPGLLILVSVLWVYASDRQWNIKKIDVKLLWVMLIPIATVAFFLVQSLISGDILAPVVSQNAWGRELTPIWQLLEIPYDNDEPNYYLNAFNRIFLISFFIFGLIVLFRMSIELGLFTLLQLAPQIISGSFDSSVRYCAVLFPVFILLAIWGKHPLVDKSITYILLTLQAIFVIGFSQGYWVV